MLEYHINMVGAEIFNQLWRQSFAETEQQLLVLPGCLRVDLLGALRRNGAWVISVTTVAKVVRSVNLAGWEIILAFQYPL